MHKIITLIKSFFSNNHIRKTPLKIAIVDDHALFRKAIRIMVESLGHFVIFEGFNGKDVIEQMDKGHLPDIVLVDVYMPGMDGFETALWLKKNYPTVKVLALGLEKDENVIIKLLKNGANGYILKTVDPQELNSAIRLVHEKGFYYSKEI